MNPRSLLCAQALSVALLLPVAAEAARAVSDLQPPQQRQVSVDLAEKLASRTAPPAAPEDLISPFNPKNFDKVESAEAPVAVAGTPPVEPPPPPGDRQILEAVAAQLTPTGTIQMEGAQLLVMGSKRFQVGDRFIVTMNGQDHELEIIAIDRTTFTLRYNRDELTRPIKAVR
jgi:hypothetical protein